MDYRIQWHWQAAITHLDLSPASPCGGEGQAPFRILSQDGSHRLASDFITRPHYSPVHSLPLAPWLHPAHFNLIFLTHVPHPSRDESVWLLPCLMFVLKVRTFPKRLKTNKGEKISKPSESKPNTSPLNMVSAPGWTFGFLCTPERILCYFLNLILEGGWWPCLVQKVTRNQGSVGSPEYSKGQGFVTDISTHPSRDVCWFLPILVRILKQTNMSTGKIHWLSKWL